MTLEVLAFDGTRVRANNRRRGSQTPDELRKMKEELADVRRRRARVDAALAEPDRAEKADEPIPGRVPMTDVQSRQTRMAVSRETSHRWRRSMCPAA